MPAILTKTIVVPRWGTGDVVLYTPSTQSNPLGQPVLNPSFTIDQSVITEIFGTSGSPNACLVSGADLYLTVTGAAHGIVKFPAYLQVPVSSITPVMINPHQQDYVGLAMDANGNLYAGAGPEYPNNFLYRFDGAAGPGINLGNAGVDQAYFGNMVFDSSQNLWVTDYWNNRVVVFPAQELMGPGPAGSVSLTNPTVNPGFPASVSYLFTSPEGIDFDSYASNANLWIANNNDRQESDQFRNDDGTTLVKITPGLRTALLARYVAGQNVTVTADQFTFNTDYSIVQAPIYTNGRSQFGGLQIDKSTGQFYVNDEAGDPTSGFVRVYNTPEAVATASDMDCRLVPNNADYYGNGGISIVNLGPWIGDTLTENGFEPDTAVEPPNVCWESPNIVATIEDQSGLTTRPTPASDSAVGIGPDGSDTVLGNAPRFVYVQVNNFGPGPTTGYDLLSIYWAKGSSTLGWPQPWDGTAGNDPAGGPLGGTVQPPSRFASIAPGGSTIVGPIPWHTPDPALYESQDGHFCLLARIVTPNGNYAENPASLGIAPSDSSILAFAGMTFPEAHGQPIDLNRNVANNARIAWRNIHIVATEPDGGTTGPYIVYPPSVVATNHSLLPLNLRVAFEILDAERRPVPHPLGPIRVSAKTAATALLERSSLGTLQPHESIAHLRSGELRDLHAGIAGLHLKPGEMLSFHVEYVAPEVRNYALRARAYSVEDGRERLIGGQTFVFGHVKGFNI